MTDFLFPNFLHDSAEYERAEKFWANNWDSLINFLGESSFWTTPWIGTSFADGTPCRDGNPIFSAVAYSRQLGIRIIQVEPKDDPQELGFWVDEFGEGDDAIKELVIACALNPGAAIFARNLMTQWITTGEVEIRHVNRASGT